MIRALVETLGLPPYSLKQSEREGALLRGLNDLTARHHLNCPEYCRIVDGGWGGSLTAGSLAEVPYLPVSLFKSQRLKSVPDEEIRVKLTSSGTTGQAVSCIKSPVSLLTAVKEKLGTWVGYLAGGAVFGITLMFSVGNASRCW